MGFIISEGATECLVVVILFLSCLVFSIARDTIIVNQTITDPDEFIISSNKAFQLGFFSPVNTTNRYVGIWYGNIPVKTVVWVANRDSPLTDSPGTMMMSEDGNLVILNGQKDIIWSSNLSNSVSNSSAQLLDSGNLVLRDNSGGRTLWESFQYPSDTFIYGMKLGRTEVSPEENTMMKSWRSPSDPSIGSFSAGLNTLNIPELFVWNGSHPCWRSGPWNGQIFIGVQYMSSVYLDGFTLVNNKGGGPYLTTNSANHSILIYLLLNHNGSLMQKNWNYEKQDWEVFWSILGVWSITGANKCDAYGTCGPFGSCNSNESPICSCLRGFEPKYVEEWNSGNFSSGCVRRTPLQCQRNNSQGSKKDGFLKLTTMKVPGFPEWLHVSEAKCGDHCLKNCSCAAYAYDDGIGCMLWSGSLIDIQKFSTPRTLDIQNPSSDGTDLYLRLAYSELDKKRNIKVVIAVPVVLGLIIIAICTYLSTRWIVKERGMKGSETRLFKNLSLSPASSTENRFEEEVNQFKLEELPLFKFEKLAIATNNFHIRNKLGEGGFGPVYSGKLPIGQEIAIKRLSKSSKQGLQEFMNEVVVISKLQHRNLVRLLGCCIEVEEKMLIYEYMPNKSLDSILFDSQKKQLLDWVKRLNIIEGIGRGLLYLHRHSRLRIIHRDLKASNVLLDGELNPKISDFGLARIFGGNENQVITEKIMGTYGYMAPEYAKMGKFSEKSDVFSFGVLLLEVLSGRRSNSFYNDERPLSILEHVWKLWNEDNVVVIIDPMLPYKEFHLEILRCVHVGLLCVQEFAEDRPTISTVLSMICSEIAHLPKPKQPAFTQAPTSACPSQLCPSKYSANDCTITIVEGR